MELRDHEVEFKKYCELCTYKDTKEQMDPCNECLDDSVNSNTTKPTSFKEATK